MQVSSDYVKATYYGETVNYPIADPRIAELGKRSLEQPLPDVSPRIIKKVKASASQINIALNIPKGVREGRFLVEIQVEREDLNLILPYSPEYSEETADVILCFEGDIFLKAHKEKLMESSQYFRAMFSGQFRESRSDVPVDLKGVDPGRAFAILQFIYSGEIMMSLEDLPWINEFAQIWSVDSLQARCVKFLYHFLTPENWTELIPYLRFYKEELVEYLAVNGERVFLGGPVQKITPELLMAVLEHPLLTIKNELKLFKEYLRWCDTNRPYNILLKDFAKEAKFEGKFFLDQMRFDLLGSDILLEEVGKLDIFTLNEMRILSKIGERNYIYMSDKERRNPLNLLTIPSFKNKNYSYKYLKYHTSAIHFYKCAFQENQLLTKEVKQGKVTFQVVGIFERGRFKIGLLRTSGFEERVVNVEFSIINQFDNRRTKTIVCENIDDSMHDFHSTEELNNPYEGWVVDGHLIIVAKVTYSKLEQEAQ